MTQNQNKHHAISSHSADSEQVEDDFVVQTQFRYDIMILLFLWTIWKLPVEVFWKE